MKEEDKNKERIIEGSLVTNEAQWIRTEQVKILYAHGLLAMLWTILFAGLLTIFLWSVIPHNVLILWFSCCLLVMFLRYLLAFAYNRASAESAQSRPWGDWYAIGQALNGIVWGCAAIWLFAKGSIAHQALLTMWVAGLVGGALGMYAVMVKVFVAFTIPAMIPLSVQFFAQGTSIHTILGLAAVIFMIVMTMNARRVNAFAMSSLKLQFENKDLIDFLTAEKERTEKLNEELTEKIEEQQRTEEALRESEEKYRTILQNIQEGYFEMDLAGNLSFFNDPFYKILGYSRDELLGLNNRDFTTPETAKRMYQSFNEIYRTGNPASIIEYEVIRKDGTIRIVEISATLTKDSSGEPIGFRGVARDISERKHAEEVMQIEKANLEQLFESAQEAIVMTDNDGRIMRVNTEFTGVFGYTRDEAIGQLLDDLVASKDLHDEALSITKRAAKGERVACETIRQHKDGTLINVSVLASPIIVGEEQVACYAIYRDITEREKMAAALRESEERYRSLFEESIDAICIAGTDGKILDFNQAALDMWGYTREEMMQLDASGLYFAPGDRSSFRQEIEKKGSVRDYEVRYRKNDGTLMECLESTTLYRADDGSIIGYQGIIHDVTERNRMVVELRQAKEDAETANRSKTEFLASMSHEIRTPMNAIIGMADLLKETPLTPEQLQYVRVFSSAGENLLNIINDILDISKVEAGHLDLEEIDFDLGEIVEKTCEVIAIRAHERGLDLAFHVMPDVPFDLVGDPVRLRQILINLIGNAIKFTEKGEVFLEVKKQSLELTEKGTGDVELLFSVTDTGIGIPPGKRALIFDSFTQADSSTTREHGGTGLGLTISKRLVELMGGLIWVESEVDQGSTFSFTARFQVQAEPKRVVRPPLVDVKGLKTLVVDDNATNRIILREILSGSGVLVCEAEDGEHVLAELKTAMDSDDPFKLMLLDCHMPGMNGFEVVEHIKKELDVTDITIMMLTSDRRSDDIARCKELGIAAYLVKPIKRSELFEAITATIGKAMVAEEPTMGMPAAPEDLQPLHILLVEDAEDNRLLIQSYLKKTPYQIEIAENGVIAVEKFTSGKYDLVLMDMQMPVMDGYTATREIRAWERKQGAKKTTPIVALTAYATKEEEKKSIDAGCTAHLTKPIKKAKLMKAIPKYALI